MPEIIDIPKMKFIAIDGMGDPNELDGEYQAAVKQIYSLAYTIRMSERNGYTIDDFFVFVVPPLEGYWWQDGVHGVDSSRKEDFQWVMKLRMPEYVTPQVFEWAQNEVLNKKKINTANVYLTTITEGLTVQILHIGPYDDEVHSVSKMHDYINQEGYQLDISDIKHHHEIYLSVTRKTDSDKLKTILRHPIKKK
ncbi:GyrI-like domain-containing protein [Ruoffia tabacinasalis]|uniref:GyrI-like domain-containing protein n=1 Tax=Ruoffia tabacinasalis TaxID=87458 RepID=UPI001F37AF0E|nr:GyrI-like domain-containing protein [Ruoffia tabacinasalis]